MTVMTKVKFIETDGQSDIQMYIFLYELHGQNWTSGSRKVKNVKSFQTNRWTTRHDRRYMIRKPEKLK